MERTKRLRVPAAALALLALLAIEPGGSPLMPPDNHSAGDISKPRPVVGGLRVAIDTDTGEKIPPPPLRLETLSSEMRAALQRSADGLILVRRADGSKYVNLDGRFMSGIAVRVGPGSASSFCTSAPQQPAAARPQTSAPARREEEM